MGTVHADILSAFIPAGGVQLNTATPTPTATPLVGVGYRARPDFLLNSRHAGRITGTVKRKGDPANVPLVRRVRLYCERDGALMRETWSDSYGSYSFEGIDETEKYTVIAWDYQHLYRAVVADNLTPELMK